MKAEKRNNSIALVSQVRGLANKLITTQLDAHGYKDLSTSHGEILFQVYKAGELRMADLAQLVRRDKSTLTVLVRKLEALGYVQREIDKTDKRVHLVSLTPKAKDFYPAFKSISTLLNDTAFEGFESYEIDMLKSLLTRVIVNLTTD